MTLTILIYAEQHEGDEQTTNIAYAKQKHIVGCKLTQLVSMNLHFVRHVNDQQTHKAADQSAEHPQDEAAYNGNTREQSM